MKAKVSQLLYIYLTVMGMVIAFAILTNAAIKDPTLSVYYNFDEGGGAVVKDGSMYGNDGEIVGDAKWENWKLGKAIVLKASTWVDLKGPDFKNKPKDGITLCVWVNHNEAGDQSIFDAIGDAHGSGLYHVEIRAGGFRWFHRDDKEAQIFNINPGPVIPGKKWVHFAGTYDSKSGDVSTYMDGTETHNAKGTGKLSDNWNTSAEIGHHKQGRWYDGLMDEFYMFNRALSAGEIKTVMEGEFSAPVQPGGKVTTTWGILRSK